jgi:hypothetical protein
VAKTADPLVPVTTITGVTRTLDDWLTSGQLCLFVLPSWPEASQYVPLIQRAFKVFREADVRCVVMVMGPEAQARKVLGAAADSDTVWLDPDGAVTKQLGVTRTPAFVHVQSDASVGAIAEGWNPAEWQRVANAIATALRWTKPIYPEPRDPEPMTGWDV